MPRHIPRFGIFIIESMSWDQERESDLDGLALKRILDVCRIPNYYLYIRTRREMEEAMVFFEATDYGFLHLSCHGTLEDIQLTIDAISFPELEEILGPYMKYRRLFLSTCEAACFALAEQFIPHRHCYSVIGPAGLIDHDKAAIFWSSYYYLMYNENQLQMWQDKIIPTLITATKTFSESMNYFSIINERYPFAIDHLRHCHFKNGQVIDQRVRTNFENMYWAEIFQNPAAPKDSPLPGQDFPILTS